jgi:hypothetical protein
LTRGGLSGLLSHSHQGSIRRADGTLADPPRLTTVAPLWRPGDTIPLGRRTLRVVEVRDGDGNSDPMLVVEDVFRMSFQRRDRDPA